MRWAAISSVLMLVGCHKPPAEHAALANEAMERRQQIPVPEAYVRQQDQDAARRLRAGLDAPIPCEDLAPMSDDKCYRFGEPQHWQGTWDLAMESSTFCPAQLNCPAKPDDAPWLEFSGVRPAEAKFPPGGVFAIEFIGRRNLLPGTFGHFGMAKSELIVDRLISIKPVEAAPEG
jgi:hypothetical protein